MKKWIALPVLLLPLALAGCSHRPAVVYAAPPPLAFDEIAQRGYNDGFAAARRDVADGRPPALERHPRFRNPPAPPPRMRITVTGSELGTTRFCTRHRPIADTEIPGDPIRRLGGPAESLGNGSQP